MKNNGTVVLLHIYIIFYLYDRLDGKNAGIYWHGFDVKQKM